MQNCLRGVCVVAVVITTGCTSEGESSSHGDSASPSVADPAESGADVEDAVVAEDPADAEPQPDAAGDSDAANAHDGTVPIGPGLADAAVDAGDSALNEIQAVGFDLSNDAPVPVLLFKAGYASYNAWQIVAPIDIAYDLVEHPMAWPAWRRTSTGVELQNGNGWAALPYKYECSALPKGTTVSGTFEQRTSTTAGTLAARQWVRRYRFTAEGTFESCEAEKTAIVATGSITTKYTQAKGSYEIDGYTLLLKHDDGRLDPRPFFYDPMRPTRLWINRAYLPVPAKDNPAICVAP